MTMRLDQLLMSRGLVTSRNKAQAAIGEGKVTVYGKIVRKASEPVAELAEVMVTGASRYVSRAGDKLASVADALELDFAAKIVLDVGSSTGGFSDFALQLGASRVYCVDVGSDQLAVKLRDDQRVVVMEQTDIREAKLPELVDVAVIDVSFISLTKIVPFVAALVKPGGVVVAMAKPQFEAGKAMASKHHGVIPLGPARDEVLLGLRRWMSEHYAIEQEIDSSISGMKGNVERFYRLRVK